MTDTEEETIMGIRSLMSGIRDAMVCLSAVLRGSKPEQGARARESGFPISRRFLGLLACSVVICAGLGWSARGEGNEG